MAKNSFKELETLLAENKDFTFNKVKHNLVGTRSMFGFIGDLIHHFLPGFFNAIIDYNKKEDLSSRSKYPHEGKN